MLSNSKIIIGRISIKEFQNIKPDKLMNGLYDQTDTISIFKDMEQEGGDDIDMTWDIKWEVETYIGDGFYQCEFKIPLNAQIGRIKIIVITGRMLLK